MATPRTRKLIVAAVVAVVILAAGSYGVFALVAGGGPAPVTESSFSPVPRSSASLSGGTDGVWILDATGDSFVGYRVTEKLAMLSAPSDAVGRTTALQGSLTVDGTNVTAVDVKADLTQLTSDDARRDDRIRGEGLETDTFPDAEFVLTSPISLGKEPAQGATVTATADGTLTIHGVTKDVTVTVQAQWSGNTIQVHTSISVTFVDYGITPPNSGFVSVEDHGTIEASLIFTKS